VVFEQTGIMPPELDVPPLPHELEHVWGYFQRLNAKRTCGMQANPISDEAILAWQRRHGIVLTPFEGECVDALDQVYMASSSETKSNE
jgi:hypothetical protein